MRRNNRHPATWVCVWVSSLPKSIHESIAPLDGWVGRHPSRHVGSGQRGNLRGHLQVCLISLIAWRKAGPAQLHSCGDDLGWRIPTVTRREIKVLGGLLRKKATCNAQKVHHRLCLRRGSRGLVSPPSSSGSHSRRLATPLAGARKTLELSVEIGAVFNFQSTAMVERGFRPLAPYVWK